jgi:hypothetical protein
MAEPEVKTFTIEDILGGINGASKSGLKFEVRYDQFNRLSLQRSGKLGLAWQRSAHNIIMIALTCNSWR